MEGLLAQRVYLVVAQVQSFQVWKCKCSCNIIYFSFLKILLFKNYKGILCYLKSKSKYIASLIKIPDSIVVRKLFRRYKFFKSGVP